ncbi:hypothetical protein V7201_21590 [Bacillus sp. JJ1122]
MPSKDFKEVGVDSQLVIVHFDPVGSIPEQRKSSVSFKKESIQMK